MGFEALSKLTKKAEGAHDYLSKKWEERKARDEASLEKVRQAERIQQRNEFLAVVISKVTGDSAVEMPALEYNSDTSHRAVFLVTMPISFGPIEVSKSSYNLLARHVGMSMSSVSHWALCVIDRGFGPSWCYDLMSDQLALTMLMKNYFRVTEITSEHIKAWSSCFYVGETSKSHEEVQALGYHHMEQHPRYNILSSNCQHLVDALVKELCNGRVISQAKLNEELSLVSPKIARDLMVAKLRSRFDKGEKEDSATVADDVHVIKGLGRRMTGLDTQ